MKKRKPVFVLLLVFLLSACSKDEQSSEWIKVANRTEKPGIDFYKITDIHQMNQINEITGGLKWQDRQIDTVGDSDYTFWLERKGDELRITNYELWIIKNDSSAVIADYVQVKFAMIYGAELNQLIQILESGHSTNAKR
ncbi:hypothetical protein [Gorillibacterium sp. sgz5001074]|uniref:hypothetical protein n=1 Tax=Gorillibacterium sp. sgz5001074 TaxID=3446695 RepID=UPI003F6726D4